MFLSNGCVYCHSGFVRPQDVRVGLYFLYPRVSLPGDATTSDSSPNIYGTARIGPDLDQESGQHPVDWEYAHFYDARYVDPLSIMPRFSFLSRQDVIDLTAFVETRSGKVGLLREAGQEWAKKVFLIAGDGNGAPDNKYPIAFDGAKLTMAQVAQQNQEGGVPGPDGSFDGLPYPDVLSVNMAPRGYWLMNNPHAGDQEQPLPRSLGLPDVLHRLSRRGRRRDQQRGQVHGAAPDRLHARRRRDQRQRHVARASTTTASCAAGRARRWRTSARA